MTCDSSRLSGIRAMWPNQRSLFLMRVTVSMSLALTQSNTSSFNVIFRAQIYFPVILTTTLSLNHILIRYHPKTTQALCCHLRSSILIQMCQITNNNRNTCMHTCRNRLALLTKPPLYFPHVPSQLSLLDNYLIVG